MRIRILVLFLIGTLSSQAALITWTNTSGGNWNNPANWSPNSVPSTNDSAVIASPGAYTVTLDVNPTVAGLVLGGESGAQTLRTAERTLTVGGTGVIGARGRFDLSGGALAGTNEISLAGVMNWIWGSIDTNTTLTVAANGQLNISSDARFAKILYGRINNAGTITWKPDGNFMIGGTLHNLPGSLFDAQVEQALIKLGTSALIINEGVFRKSVRAGALECSVPLVNHGTIETQAGTLRLADGSAFHSGSLFSGAGLTALDAGTNTVNGHLTSENLELRYGAVLTGTGTFSGTLTWGGGIIGEGAVITVATNARLQISSDAKFAKTLLGTLINAGTITWQPNGNLVIGGALQNLAGALFDAQTSVALIALGDSPLIVNDGTFQKSVGAGVTTIEPPLINRGLVKVAAGTLLVGENYTHAGGTLALAGGNVSSARSIYLADGRLSGWGVITADLTNNAATIAPSSSDGVLTINGSYTQLLRGHLALTLGGNTPGANQSKLAITGAARLSGFLTVQLAENYLPNPDTQFTVLSFASRSGDFAGLNGLLLLGHDRRLLPQYEPRNLTLLTISEPDPTEVPLRVTVKNGAALVAWPAEFRGFTLSSSTNLNDQTWTALPGLTNWYLEPPPLPREKYFRVLQPQ